MSAFSLPFMQLAVAASLLSGIALGWLGVFILQRKVSFTGLSVSQLAALGAVVSISLDWGHAGESAALVSVIGGLLLLSWLAGRDRASTDAWIAALYIVGAGASVLCLSKAPHGEAHTMSIFFGNILSLTRSELAEAAAIFVLTLGALRAYLHRWVWLSFDPLSAEIAGIDSRLWEVLFYSLCAVVLTVSIHVCGVLLSFAYLIAPGALALLFVRRMDRLIAAIAGLAAAATIAGFWLSFHWDFPTGPFVATILAGLLLAGGIWRRIVG